MITNIYLQPYLTNTNENITHLGVLLLFTHLLANIGCEGKVFFKTGVAAWRSALVILVGMNKSKERHLYPKRYIQTMENYHPISYFPFPTIQTPESQSCHYY